MSGVGRSARPRRRSVASGVCMVVATVLAAAACQPLPPPEPGSVLIGCDLAGTRTVVTVTAHLDPACDYAGIDVVASGVTLDCQGATIAGQPGEGGRGILISSPVDVALHDVTVRNCNVEGFLNSLRVTRDGFRNLEPGEEYDHTTARILIERSTFTGSRGVGVFVDGYVEDVTIRDSRIEGAGSSGIYLETGSRRNQVRDNLILNNGLIENGPGGKLYNLAGVDFWFWGIGREGISIDGSYENAIEGNLLAGNSAGGVFLYKNCGEYPDRPAYFERRYPSDRNTITANTFVGGTNGVWIGSRMGENTLPMDCTDPAYVDEPLNRVVLDRAADNVVAGNAFHGVTHGVRVEDDGNRVEGNAFHGTPPALRGGDDGPENLHAVIVGTPWRTSVLGRPVAGTVVRDNVSTIEGNPHPYRWVSDEAGSTVEGNVALGEPVGWCEAPEPPRGPFVFVIAVALAGPGGTPPAVTPELAHPTQPALAPCPGDPA